MNDVVLNNLFFAHRGIHNNIDIPENSIIAFKLALNKNIPIELDVQLLKDDNIVVFHDNNLKRMVGINKNICDMTYNELNKYYLLNTNYKIPLLEDVLKLINNKVLINIEIKSNNCRICNILNKKLENYNNFIIQSFNTKIVKWYKKNKKEYLVGILISNYYKKYKLKTNIIPKLIIKLTNPDFLSIKKVLVDRKFIKKYKNSPIIVWTINNEYEIANYIKYTNNFVVNIKSKK